MPAQAGRHVATMAVLAHLALSSCQSTYRAKTVLHADGSVDREIYQPVEAAVQVGPGQGWSRPVYSEDPSLKAGAKRYFTAAGHFASPEQIPDHAVFVAWQGTVAPDLPAGKLKRHYRRTDHVFVVDHEWVETLTDTVTFDGMQESRGRLANLCIDVARDTFDEVLGKEYDGSELFGWLRADGSRWLAELTDFAFVQMLQAKHELSSEGQLQTETQERLARGAAAICARHGLQLTRGGRLLGGEEFGRVSGEFALDLVARTVRRRSTGRPVDRRTAAGWLDELTAHGRMGGEDAPNRFEVAVRKAAARYGGEDALKKQFARLLTDVAGVYWPDFLSIRMFDYTLTVPGQVVRTNGQIVANDRIRWRFDARMAWPLGYDMACRAMEPQMQVQQDLLGGQPLNTREAMLEFLTLVNDFGDTDVAAVLRQCRDQRSMAPLYECRERLPEGALRAEGGLKFDRLFKLLRLPPERP